MIARKNDHDRIWIRPRNVYQGRENCGSRALIEGLHDSLGRPIRKARKIIALVRSHDGIHDLTWGYAPFRSVPGLLKECSATEKWAKLLRPIISPHTLRQFSQADAVSSSQDKTPTMRRGSCSRTVRPGYFF
jgi:hypothetical protein